MGWKCMFHCFYICLQKCCDDNNRQWQEKLYVSKRKCFAREFLWWTQCFCKRTQKHWNIIVLLVSIFSSPCPFRGSIKYLFERILISILITFQAQSFYTVHRLCFSGDPHVLLNLKLYWIYSYNTSYCYWSLPSELSVRLKSTCIKKCWQ